MWLFNRRYIIGVLTLPILAGCGFEPVHGTGKAASAVQNRISIEQKDGRKEFEFRDHLQSRLGRANADAPYIIKYTLSVSEKKLAVSSAVEITRYNLLGTLTYSVIEQGTLNKVFEDEVFTTTSYSATSETYPTRVAAQAANVRLAHSLADQVFTRISITAKDWLK